MPAIGKITLDAKEYEKTLARIKQKTGSAANDMSRSVKKVGSDVYMAGRVFSAFGTAAGRSFGAAGQAVSAIASGPIVALTAALGALVAVGVKVWDSMTLSAEEYAQKLDRVAKKQAESYSKLVSRQADDAGFMDRLTELSKQESLSNAQKTEAARLIEMLSSRYGDLGISIDGVTGSIDGMDEAQKRFLAHSIERQKDLLAQQLYTARRQAEAKGSAAVSSSMPGQQTLERMGLTFRGADDAKKIVTDLLRTRSSEDALSFANTIVSQSNSKESIDAWSAVADQLLKIIELEQKLDALTKTGFESQKKEADALKKASGEEQKKLDEEAARADAAKKAADAEIEAERKKADEIKAIEARITADIQEEADARKKAEDDWKSCQSGQASSLRDRILRMSGKSDQADREKAIADAERAKGSMLTMDEEKRVLSLHKFSSYLDDAAKGSPVAQITAQANALVARGGSASGAKLPDITRYQKSTADSAKSLVSISEKAVQILERMITI